ncbi:MAG: MATE family efflux transporter [Bacteroidales bacterium]
MQTAISTRRIWKVAYPIIVGSIAQNILNVTDTAFLGRLGEIALGGGVVGGLFYQVLLMLGWGTAMGGQIIIARRYGEGANKSIGRVVEHLLYFLLLLALIVVFISSFLSGQLLSFLVESRAIYESGKAYIDFRMPGLIFAFIAYSFNSFYVGITRTKIITVSTLIMVTVNIVLDYVLIFGHWGFPPMGISGAALASVIAEVTGATTYIIYTRFKFNYKPFNLFRFGAVNFRLLARLLSIAWPLMIQFTLSIFVWFVFFLFIEKMGETPLAASNILRSIYIVLMIPIWGFASATNTFVSQLIGQERSNEVLLLIRKIITLSISAVFLLVLVCIAIPELLLKIYTNDPVLIGQSLPVFYVVAVAALGMAAAFVMLSGVSGTGNTWVSFILEVFTLLVYLTWAYLMSNVFVKSLSWVWSSEILYSILIVTLSYIYLKSNKWLGKKV